MDRSTEQRLAENEVIFREANKDAQNFIEGGKSNPKATVDFYCECSRPECRERITLTSDAYKELHQNKRQFIAISGHEVPEVEKVVREEKGFNVIEKFADPPSSQEIDRAVKSLEL